MKYQGCDLLQWLLSSASAGYNEITSGCDLLQWFELLHDKGFLTFGRSQFLRVRNATMPPANPHWSRKFYFFFFSFFFFKQARIGRRHWGSAASDGDTAQPHSNWLVPILTSSQDHILIWLILLMLRCQIVNSDEGQISNHLYLDPILPLLTAWWTCLSLFKTYDPWIQGNFRKYMKQV